MYVCGHNLKGKLKQKTEIDELLLMQKWMENNIPQLLGILPAVRGDLDRFLHCLDWFSYSSVWSVTVMFWKNTELQGVL